MHTYEKILEALGEASMCWSETPQGVFDSTKGIEIAKKLYEEILKEKSGNLPEANRNAVLADGLPDHYAGDLNKQRIKQYKMLANRYGVKDDIAMHIFCAGADWYKQQVKGNVT